MCESYEVIGRRKSRAYLILACIAAACGLYPFLSLDHHLPLIGGALAVDSVRLGYTEAQVIGIKGKPPARDERPDRIKLMYGNGARVELTPDRQGLFRTTFVEGSRLSGPNAILLRRGSSESTVIRRLHPLGLPTRREFSICHNGVPPKSSSLLEDLGKLLFPKFNGALDYGPVRVIIHAGVAEDFEIGDRGF